MTRSDWKVLLIVLALGLALLAVNRMTTRQVSQSGNLVVEVKGRAMTTLSVAGPLHRVTLPRVGMTIEVGQGRARVVKSDCPEQICVKTGWISRAGQTIVCVPNRTVFRLTGKEGLDAISQ